MKIATANCRALHFDVSDVSGVYRAHTHYNRVTSILNLELLLQCDIVCLQEIGSEQAYLAVRDFAQREACSACICIESARSSPGSSRSDDALLFVCNGRVNPAFDDTIRTRARTTSSWQPLLGNVIVTRLHVDEVTVERYNGEDSLFTYGNQHMLVAKLRVDIAADIGKNLDVENRDRDNSAGVVVVACTHLSMFKSERSAQLAQMNAWLSRSRTRIDVLCGDMNDTWANVQAALSPHSTRSSCSSTCITGPTVRYDWMDDAFFTLSCLMSDERQQRDTEQGFTTQKCEDQPVDHIITLTPRWTVLPGTSRAVDLITPQLSDHNAVVCELMDHAAADVN